MNGLPDKGLMFVIDHFKGCVLGFRSMDFRAIIVHRARQLHIRGDPRRVRQDGTGKAYEEMRHYGDVKAPRETFTGPLPDGSRGACPTPAHL